MMMSDRDQSCLLPHAVCGRPGFSLDDMFINARDMHSHVLDLTP